MNRFLLGAATLLLGSFALSAAPAGAETKPRTYDCTKAGNANKAACKTAATPVPKPAPKPAPKPTPKPVATATPAARNYDCSKAGNANKAACKTATTAAKPVPAPKPVAAATPKARNYDCSKAGNANKAACAVTVKPAPPASVARAATPAPTIHQPAPVAHPVVAPADQNTHAGGPDGATAKCKDGTYSKSAHRSGTCSRHGGVAQWY